MPAQISREPIFTLGQYIQRVEQCFDTVTEEQEDRVLFRGQSCDKVLLPKIWREETPLRFRDGQLKTQEAVLKIEKQIFDEFKLNSRPFLGIQTINDFDSLAVAQHYGLFTRFLDWTKDALAALWFAVSHCPKQDQTLNGVVWFLRFDEEDVLGEGKIDELIRTKKGPFTIDRCFVYRPNQVINRIIAQQSFLTLHSSESNEKFTPLEDDEKFKRKIAKIEIRKDAFCMIRNQLDHYNMNAARMLPDLEGIAKNLNWQHSRLPDENECGTEHKCNPSIKEMWKKWEIGEEPW